MPRERRIEGVFNNSRSYFQNSLGREFDFTAATGPYEYLLGALSGCLFATFRELSKDLVTYDEARIEVVGIKDEEKKIQTLKTTSLNIRVTNCSNETLFREKMEEASSLCSIYNTIKLVSEMKINYIFN